MIGHTRLLLIASLLLFRHGLARGQHAGGNRFDDEAYFFLVHESPWLLLLLYPLINHGDDRVQALVEKFGQGLNACVANGVSTDIPVVLPFQTE